MEELAARQFVAGASLLSDSDLASYSSELGNDWIVKGDRLTKAFSFPDFVTALAFVNKVGDIAEAMDHHPDLHLGYGRVGVETWTHSAGGLTENDFILAARIEQASR